MIKKLQENLGLLQPLEQGQNPSPYHLLSTEGGLGPLLTRLRPDIVGNADPDLHSDLIIAQAMKVTEGHIEKSLTAV